MKPVPVKDAELIVTGLVPEEVSFNGCVDVVFTVTLPKARLAELMVNAATLAPGALSCSAKVLETPPALAVKVTVSEAVTAATVAVNPALAALAGTVTVVGTSTAALLLVRPTLIPLLPATELNVTVQLLLPAPVRDALAQETALNAPEATVPLPELGVFVVLFAEEPPQPETLLTIAQQMRVKTSLAREPSGRRAESRLHGEYGPNNVLTSVNAPALPRLTEKHCQVVVLPTIPWPWLCGHCNILTQIKDDGLSAQSCKVLCLRIVPPPSVTLNDTK